MSESVVRRVFGVECTVCRVRLAIVVVAELAARGGRLTRDEERRALEFRGQHQRSEESSRLSNVLPATVRALSSASCAIRTKEWEEVEVQPHRTRSARPRAARSPVCLFQTVPGMRICGRPTQPGNPCCGDHEGAAAEPETAQELAAVSGVELDPMPRRGAP